MPEQQRGLSRFLLAWSQARDPPRLYLFPGQEDWMLLAFVDRDQPMRAGWRYLVDDSAIHTVKGRLGLLPVKPAPTAPAPEPRREGARR